MKRVECHCDRCESMRAGEPDSLPMAGGCERCGGRAKLPPLCLVCLEQELHWALQAACARGAHGTLHVLATLRAQLPAGAARVEYWRAPLPSAEC